MDCQKDPEIHQFPLGKKIGKPKPNSTLSLKLTACEKINMNKFKTNQTPSLTVDTVLFISPKYLSWLKFIRESWQLASSIHIYCIYIACAGPRIIFKTKYAWRHIQYLLYFYFEMSTLLKILSLNHIKCAAKGDPRSEMIYGSLSIIRAYL